MKSENDLIWKCLEGDASASEVKELEAWLSKSNANLDEYKKIKSIWAATKGSAVDEKSAWVKLEGNLEAKTFKLSIAYGIAASLTILSIVSYIIFSNSKEEFAVNSETDLVSISSDNIRRSVLLPDSSLITLNKNSQIEYQRSFSERKIFLKGEAFFDIKNLNDSPFMVVTDSMNVQVIGTSFSVSSYNYSGYSVSVESGIVQVSNAIKSKFEILKKNEKARIINNKIDKKPLDDPNAFSWKTGVLEFNNTTLGQAARVLEKQYDIEIKFINEKITNCPITARFDNNTIEEIVTLLEDTFQFQINYENSKMSVDGEEC